MGNTFAAHKTKTTLVVMDENTLGFILPESNLVGILRAYVLKGAVWSLEDNPRLPSEQIRLATEKDFQEYRVAFDGYADREKYLYS